MNPILSIKNRKPFALFSIIVFTFTLLSLSSCLKDSGIGPRPDVEPPVSALTVINGAPDAPAFDFVLNEDLVLPVNVPYGERMLYFYPFSRNYLVRFYIHKTFTNPLYSTKINLNRGKYHSLFLVGTVSDSLSSLLIEDDLTKPRAGNSKVRFINLSPDAGGLNFSLTEDSLFASKIEFKQYTDFYEVPMGEYKAKLKTSTDFLIQKNYTFELKLEEGKIYTVWARGLVETSEKKQEFEHGLIKHDLGFPETKATYD